MRQRMWQKVKKCSASVKHVTNLVMAKTVLAHTCTKLSDVPWMVFRVMDTQVRLALLQTFGHLKT